jgi:hypothetical protein
METTTYDCSGQELVERETDLRSRGFRLSAVSEEKALKPMEYLKRPYTGDAASFGGSERWTVIARAR